MRVHDVRLSTRITLSALILVAVAALVLMFLEEARLRDAYLGERRADLAGALQTNQSRLTHAIDTLRQDVLFLSSVPPVAGLERAARNGGYDPNGGTMGAEWKTRLAQIFAAFASARPDYYHISFVTVADGGREIVHVDNVGGAIAAFAPGRLQDEAYREMLDATVRLAAGEVYLSDFRVDADNGPPAPALLAAIPVFAPAGPVFGVLVIGMDTRRLLASTREGLPAGVLAYVTDMSGRYLLHPNGEPSAGGERRTNANVAADLPRLAALLDARAAPVMALQAVPTRGGKSYVAAQRIHFDARHPERFVVLAYRLADEQALRRAAAIPAPRIAAGFAVLLLVGAIVRFALRRTFSPLDELAAAATRITAGSRAPLLPQAGGGEIGSLTRAINGMLTELTQREQEISRINAGLEQQVAQRTAELSAANARLRKEVSEREALLKRNQSLMAASMDGIHVMDMTGDVVQVNDAFCHMLGYTRDEAMRLNVSDWSLDWPSEGVVTRFRKLIGASIRIETRHRRKDGSVIDVEINASGVDIAGEGYIYASSRDITERKRAEGLLRQHKVIIDTAQDGFWLIDETGRLLDANEAYARMSGYPVDELVGMHICDLDATARSPQQVRATIDRMIARGGHVRFETRHRCKDGREIDMEISATWIPESRRISAFCHDITLRKQAEQALRIAAATFETRDAIVITDAANNIVRVNRAFTDITGYSAQEVLGKNPRIMGSGRHEPAFFADMWEQLLHTGSWAGEILDRRKDGQLYTKWLTITAVKDARGETTHYVAIFSDISARKRAEEEIRTLAFYDVLTGLPNRRLFLDRLRAVLSASMRHQDYGAVLFIDLDRFKTLNDTLGHDYGDLLLIEVAARLEAGVREMDTVARLGGDEFVVLIEALSHDQEDASHKVGQVAEKIREALARPYRIRDHEHHSSPSIGIALFQGNAASVETLLQQADMAMYQAKASGRNAVCFFDPAMQRSAATRAALERDLREAVAARQLELHFQLQVDHEQRAVGAEALLRWRHPQRGMVMPREFLPIAEEGALILAIGQWVLENACRLLDRWREHPSTRELTLAVNISRKQFAMPDFVGQVAALLGAHRFAPGRLKLELTERLVLDDLAGAVSKMHALRALGVTLSMDEFGTGYSSLSYLKRLPLDQLKIDQGFVQGITHDGNDALLVQTIIALANNVHVDVIAEGVETEAQVAFLRHHDCIAFQGYLFGEPVAIEEFEALLEGAEVPRQR